MISIPNAFGVQVIDNIDLYACSYSSAVLYKMDLSLNILMSFSGCQITPCLSGLNSIEHEKISNQVYVGSDYIIYMFTRDLVLVDSLSISCYVSAMKIYNQVLFVACINVIYTYTNKVLTSTLTNICTSSSAWIYSMFFINSESMLISCYYDNYIKSKEYNLD